MHFKIEKKLKQGLGRSACAGRAGVLKTAHGEIKTPAFVAVATKASVKALTPKQIFDLGAEIIIGNTYHLYLQPGDELVAKAGGLHKFMNWNGPIMTDSGGFQVFSLGAAYGKGLEGKQASYGAGLSKIMKKKDLCSLIPERPAPYQAEARLPDGQGFGSGLAKIGQDGVSFKSHLDGSVHYITPEKSIQIQHNLGADIIFAFDECVSPSADLHYQEEALERTHRWAERSLAEHKRLGRDKEFSFLGVSQAGEPRGSAARARADSDPKKKDSFSLPALFGIVQGGRDENLRKKSAKILSEMRTEGPEGSEGFDGFGIGGSFAKEDMLSAVKWVSEILPEEKPRHLLGIGEPEDLFMGVENGVDLFDCVMPTRNARNGMFYTKNGKISILNAKYRNDFLPIEEGCGCYACRPAGAETSPAGEVSAPAFSRAYLAHLFHGKEMLAATLASIHNLYFIVNLVKKIRQSILDDNFFEFKEEFLKKYTK